MCNRPENPSGTCALRLRRPGWTLGAVVVSCWRQVANLIHFPAFRRLTGQLIVLPLVLVGVGAYAVTSAAYLLFFDTERIWLAHPSWMSALLKLLIALGAPLLMGYFWQRSRPIRRVLQVADWFGAGMIAYSVVWTGWALHEFVDVAQLNPFGLLLLPYSWAAWGVLGTALFIFGAVDLSHELSTEWRERQRLEALMQFTQRITSLDYQTSLNEMVRHLHKLLESDSCVLYLWNEEEQVLVPVAGEYNPNAYPAAYVDRVMNFRCPMGFGITGWVMQTGAPYVSGDVVNDMHAQAVPGWHGDEKSTLLAPIAVEGRRLGVVRLSRKGIDQFNQDDLDLVLSFAGQAALVLEHGRIVKELSELSITDNMTGLYNARHFHTVAEMEVARAERSGEPLALIMLDSDSLKHLNDLRGHQRGDEHIRRIGRVLRSYLRLSDYAFRYAGDEFLLLLPNTGRDEALTVAERIRTLIEEGDTDEEMSVTASLGVAVYPTHGSDARTLLSVADRAMYESKRLGKNRVTIAQAALNQPNRPVRAGDSAGEQYMADLGR
jgi:diguanylate cyclase (GGDEF)-like protein